MLICRSIFVKVGPVGQWVVYDIITKVSFSDTPCYVQDNEGGKEREYKMMTLTLTKDSKDADEGKGKGSGKDPGGVGH